MHKDTKTYDPCDPIRDDETYNAVLHIIKMVHAAEMLADATPVLHTSGAPPIQYLLERALDDLDKLAQRVSPKASAVTRSMRSIILRVAA